MALITVSNEKFRTVTWVSQLDKFSSQHPNEILSKFKDAFEDDLGQLPGEVRLEVDPSIIPYVTAARRIRIAIKSKLKAELERLVEKKVIEPV